MAERGRAVGVSPAWCCTAFLSLSLVAAAPGRAGAQASPPQVADTLLYERLDLYDPETGAFSGSEVTHWAADGRRLRLEVTDAEGAPTLLFYLRHDALGREVEGIYFESDPFEPWVERFTYRADGRMKTTTYVQPDGSPGERTESDLDEAGREVFKRYYRANGTAYGEEDVLWNPDGTSAGWEFRYLERDERALYTYEYEAGQASAWTRRLRRRNGEAQRVEVRTVRRGGAPNPFPTAVSFARGVVSTDRSETSPSFTADGRTMVFARYDEDWNDKEPFLARLDDDGWSVEDLDFGPVYNLAITPDGEAIFFARAADRDRTVYRVRRRGSGWSEPESLSARYGVVGSYPAVTEDGDLYLYDADGADGAGVYLARARGGGFDPARPVFVPPRGDAFDAFARRTGDPLLVTRCFDDACDSGPANGVWLVDVARGTEEKLERVPYAWGAQPVEALGLFVFTDGDDVLALPLALALPQAPSDDPGGAR